MINKSNNNELKEDDFHEFITNIAEAILIITIYRKYFSEKHQNINFKRINKLMIFLKTKNVNLTKINTNAGLSIAFGNIFAELVYPLAVWLVLLWPLVLHPAWDALARSAISLWPC